MTKAEILLRMVSDKHDHRMADFPHGDALAMVLDAMQEFADYKLNKDGQFTMTKGRELIRGLREFNRNLAGYQLHKDSYQTYKTFMKDHKKGQIHINIDLASECNPVLVEINGKNIDCSHSKYVNISHVLADAINKYLNS